MKLDFGSLDVVGTHSSDDEFLDTVIIRDSNGRYVMIEISYAGTAGLTLDTTVLESGWLILGDGIAHITSHDTEKDNWLEAYAKFDAIAEWFGPYPAAKPLDCEEAS